MNIYLNDKKVALFKGAKAADALRAYQHEHGPLDAKQFYDAYGNKIASDSPLAEGRKIFTYPTNKRP